MHVVIVHNLILSKIHEMSLNSSQIEDSFSTTDEDVKKLLFGILNLNLQNSSNERTIISSINKLLLVSKTRLQGLEFLNLIIGNCSKAIISENALKWISHCLVKYPGDNLKEVKLTTIGKITESVYNDQEYTKKFVADYLPKVFENCIATHINSHETEAAIDVLTICMNHYASWFAPHKMKIEDFIINFLENSSEKLVEKAAVAFLYLQQVGGAGANGINHRTNFHTNFEKLCATVQKLFDKFFENESEIYHSDRSNQDAFSFTDFSHHSQKMLHITTRRITNCLIFVRTMLQKSFPVAKDVKPLEVLDIIGRGTAIHQCLTTDNEKSLEDFQFSLLLNKIQIQLLYLLRMLILWLHANALPFSFTISKILIDCLNKSQNCQCFTTDSLYQETVYKVLSCWIRIAKNSLHPHFQTQLVNCILKDISPVKNEVTLTLQSDIPKSKSFKAKSKLIKERIISSGQGSTLEKLTTVEKLNSEKNCIFALDTLKQLQTATTLRLKANVLQNLYTSITNPILEIQTSKTSHPYTNSQCQAKLYEVLVAFYEQETLTVLPPIQLTVNILNRGVNSNNRHIALTCEHGLSILEKLCQPICPSLFLPEASVSEKPLKEATETPFNIDVLDKLFEETTNEIEKIEKDILKQDDVDEIVKDTNVENGGETYKEEMVQTTEIEIESEKRPEPGMEETNIDIETKIYQDDLNEACVSPNTLLKQNSVHIIDVQVIKHSAIDLEAVNIADSARGISLSSELDGKGQVNFSQNDEDFAEVNVFKEDIVSSISIDVPNAQLESDQPKFSPKESVMMDDTDKTEEEPPLKKSRTEDGADIAEKVKDEPKGLEEIDDVFEEDAFVDEIKEY